MTAQAAHFVRRHRPVGACVSPHRSPLPKSLALRAKLVVQPGLPVHLPWHVQLLAIVAEPVFPPAPPVLPPLPRPRLRHVPVVGSVARTARQVIIMFASRAGVAVPVRTVTGVCEAKECNRVGFYFRRRERHGTEWTCGEH